MIANPNSQQLRNPNESEVGKMKSRNSSTFKPFTIMRPAAAANTLVIDEF